MACSSLHQWFTTDANRCVIKVVVDVYIDIELNDVYCLHAGAINDLLPVLCCVQTILFQINVRRYV